MSRTLVPIYSLFKSGLHSTARALLSETSSSSSNVLSPSARDSSLTASPSSIPGGSPLPSTSTSNNTAATNPNGSRTKSISSHLSSNPDPSSGNNDALSDSPHAVDEAMNSPSNRKTEDVDATGGVGTLPSPESGTGGSVGGVKEDGGSEKAETTRTNTTLSDGGTSRRKEASEAIKLRDPAVEGATGPKGQLLEWWTIFQDVSKVHSTLSKSVPSSDSEVYLSSVIAGQSLPSSNSTALVGPSNISGQALPPPPGSYVGGPPQHQQQRIIAGMGGQQQQQQMQPGQQQRKVMMAGAHGVPVSQQWLVSRDGPEGHPVPMSLQQQQQLAHKNAQMQQQQQQQQNMRPPPAQGPNGQLQHQRMQQQQPMSQFAGHPGMDPQQQAQFAQQQQQSQAQLQHQQQQQQHHHQQLEAARVRNQQAHRALQNQVHETAQLLKYPREAIESYVNYPPNELQIVADQLQEALRRANMERRPLAEGDEPSPKRTRVEGPPRVSMQQQQQQAMRQVTGGQQGGRIPSGQMHPNGQQQHHPQQQQSPFPPVDFNPQVPGGPQPQTKAQSAQGYAQFMHRRASEQQAQAQAAGSPYNGSMPPPATPATPAFAGSPSAPQQQYDNGAPRPASQASHHGQAYPGSNQMSRSGSGSEQYSNGTTPGPSSTPRIVQGTLPAGELVGNGAPVAASGGKGKGKPAPKKPRVKKVTKAAAAAEPPSPAPRPESSMSHHSPYPPAPQSVPQQQPSPFPPQQPTPPPPPPPPAQQQVVQQQQQPEELVDHHQQQINPSEFDIGNLGGDVNGFDGSFNMDGLELDQYMSYDTSGVGSNGGEEFDFSSWMVEETN
ncbi:hypothetical protein BDY24DRAFT_150640 [Mrakia frigida]|uniref:uncharacterized protein n=1 Tax=Mrakia frigida TaxID=29902 RepID=UPI003FCC0E1E